MYSLSSLDTLFLKNFKNIKKYTYMRTFASFKIVAFRKMRYFCFANLRLNFSRVFVFSIKYLLK